MSTRNTYLTVHPALGGLDVSSDPTVLDPNFLTNADNIEYREGGQRKKRPGFRVYSTALTSTQVVSSSATLLSTTTSLRALRDCWRYGTSLTPTHNYLAVAGASLFVSTGAAGVWKAISVSSSFGVDANRNTNITLAGDYAVVSDGAAAPIAWDQSIATSSGLVAASTGSVWPVFTNSIYHLNRLWLHGLSTSPSLLAYTAANNIFDSTGTDTGSFTVNAGDGDALIGVSKPYYGAIYAFKGPHIGSVFQLSGGTPSAFALAQVGHGAPLMNSRALVTTPTDIYWLSQYGVHSLETTVKFGNVEQAFLSLPIQKLWRDGVFNRAQLANAWGFWHPLRNIVGWAVTPSGASQQIWLIVYNYALSDPKPGGKKYWSIWKFSGVGMLSGAICLIDSNHDGSRDSVPVLMLGTDQGTVWEGDLDNQLTDIGAAYTAKITTPVITRFETPRGRVPETQEKGFIGVVTYFMPHGAVTANLSVTVDRRTQAYTVDLSGGGATLT